MSMFDDKAKKVVEFYEAAQQAKLLEHMHPAQHEQLESFVTGYRKHIAPDEALQNYYLKIAPHETTFARTRVLLGAVVGLLRSWTDSESGAETLLAATGAWVLGDDEAEDLERLSRFHAAFVAKFGGAGLPPSLRKEALAEQVKAHVAAQKAMPSAPPKQTLMQLNAGQRALDDACHKAFQNFHNFLDGYFGKTGDEAFKQKATFAYDRRVGRASSGGEKPASPARPLVTPPAPVSGPGPVASGTEAPIASPSAPATPAVTPPAVEPSVPAKA